MKLVIAVIKPFKLEEVREALTAAGVQGLMVSEVKGYGRQAGHTEIYRGAEYVVNFVPKVRLETVVPDEAVPAVMAAIAGGAAPARSATARSSSSTSSRPCGSAPARPATRRSEPSVRNASKRESGPDPSVRTAPFSGLAQAKPQARGAGRPCRQPCRHSAGGITTASITWITPFVAMMSVAVTLASSTFTPAPSDLDVEVRPVDGLGFVVLRPPRPQAACRGTTW